MEIGFLNNFTFCHFSEVCQSFDIYFKLNHVSQFIYNKQ